MDRRQAHKTQSQIIMKALDPKTEGIVSSESYFLGRRILPDTLNLAEPAVFGVHIFNNLSSDPQKVKHN